jgi:diguanylate cyclase
MDATGNPTHDLARQALARMAQLGLGGAPENYEVWYHYFADDMPALKRAIDGELGNGRPIDDEAMAALHEQFFRNHQAFAILGNATERFEGAIETVDDTLRAAQSAAEDYGQTLEGFVQMAELAQPGALPGLAKDILSETRRVAADATMLKQRLSATTSEMGRLKEDLEQLRREAFTDEVTGLANRKAFDTAITQQVLQSMESGEPFSLLMLDIDHFKQFNDSFGHQLGDSVLRLVGRMLHECVKGRDRPARYGGEEFAIILRGARLTGGHAVAEQIRLAIGDKKIVRRTTNEELGWSGPLN